MRPSQMDRQLILTFLFRRHADICCILPKISLQICLSQGDITNGSTTPATTLIISKKLLSPIEVKVFLNYALFIEFLHFLSANLNNISGVNPLNLNIITSFLAKFRYFHRYHLIIGSILQQFNSLRVNLNFILHFRKFIF